MVHAPASHNRTVYAAPAAADLVSIRLGQSPADPSHASLRHFAGPGRAPAVRLLRKALIQAGKTSYTAGTLCAMAF